jgi:hypothetical protein
MKSKPVERKQTLKLKVDQNVNYRLIGISSHENDYRLVWCINSQLKMQFARIENLIVHNRKFKTDFEFSRYRFHDEDRYLNYYLISNRCPNGFLLPEIKNFDFLIQIIGEINDEDVKEFIKKIKNVMVISAAFMFEASKLKDIDKILQE